MESEKRCNPATWLDILRNMTEQEITEVIGSTKAGHTAWRKTTGRVKYIDIKIKGNAETKSVDTQMSIELMTNEGIYRVELEALYYNDTKFANGSRTVMTKFLCKDVAPLQRLSTSPTKVNVKKSLLVGTRFESYDLFLAHFFLVFKSTINDILDKAMIKKLELGYACDIPLSGIPEKIREDLVEALKQRNQ